MKLKLRRFDFGLHHTVGTLHVDGHFLCFTLEDRTRHIDTIIDKVAAETAVPSGTYELVVDKSQRFGKPLPRLLNVPYFTGIRIHAGNTAKDTEGCILLGLSFTSGTEFIGSSRKAMHILMAKLATATDKIEIEVS